MVVTVLLELCQRFFDSSFLELLTPLNSLLAYQQPQAVANIWKVPTGQANKGWPEIQILGSQTENLFQVGQALPPILLSKNPPRDQDVLAENSPAHKNVLLVETDGNGLRIRGQMREFVERENWKLKKQEEKE